MIAKLNFYDNQQFTGEPEISCEATAFLYDDNLTFQENCQEILSYEGRQNIKPQLDFAPSSSDPAFYKRSYCKELYYRIGVVLARIGLVWRQWDTSDIQDFPGNKLYSVGVSTTSNIGTPIFVKTNFGYEFNLINGYTGSQGYETNPNTLMTWLNENPQGSMEAYFKILYSYNEDNETYIRGVIVGFKGYVFGTTNDVIRVELSTQFTGQTIIDLEDEPGDEDMKINTPNTKELFNRQYILRKGQIEKVAELLQNLPELSRTFPERLGDMLMEFLGMNYTDWINSIVDIQLFPVNFVYPQNIGASRIRVGNGVRNVRFSAVETSTDFPDQFIHFNNDVFPVLRRDCLLDATRWIKVERQFNDFRDYPPYCSSQLYLPFIGIIDVDLSLYYNKYLKIKYAIDISSGGCRAFICVGNSESQNDDGHIIGQYDGAMGIHCPITKIEWSDYYNSIANGYSATISSAMSAGTGLAVTSALNSHIKNKNIDYIKRETSAGRQAKQSGLQQYQSYDITSLATPFEMGRQLTQAESRIPAMTTGSASGYLNECCDYHCYMFWYYVDTEETANLQALKGYVSDKSGTLNEFTGYLECSDVKLVCPKATENEKTRLVQLLTSGIYI